MSLRFPCIPSLLTMPVSSLRRVIAAMLLLCVGMLTFEQFSFDVCDEAVERVDTQVAQVVAQVVAHDNGSGATKPVQPQPEDISHSGMHICHCLHGHFGTLSVSRAMSAKYLTNNSLYDELSVRLPSVALEPPHRPPLAIA